MRAGLLPEKPQGSSVCRSPGFSRRCCFAQEHRCLVPGPEGCCAAAWGQGWDRSSPAAKGARASRHPVAIARSNIKPRDVRCRGEGRAVAVLPPAPLPTCPTPACAAASPLPAATPLCGDRTACPRSALPAARRAACAGTLLPRYSLPAAPRPAAPFLPSARTELGSEGPLCPGSYGAFLSPRPPPGGSAHLRPHRSRGSAAAHRARCAELCCPLPGRAVLAGSGTGAARRGGGAFRASSKAVLKRERLLSSQGGRKARHGAGAHRPSYHQGYEQAGAFSEPRQAHDEWAPGAVPGCPAVVRTGTAMDLCQSRSPQPQLADFFIIGHGSNARPGERCATGSRGCASVRNRTKSESRLRETARLVLPEHPAEERASLALARWYGKG